MIDKNLESLKTIIISKKITLATTIPCPFFVGRVKRQRNPTHLLGYGYGSYVATQAIATLWLTPPVRDT